MMTGLQAGRHPAQLRLARNVLPERDDYGCVCSMRKSLPRFGRGRLFGLMLQPDTAMAES